MERTSRRSHSRHSGPILVTGAAGFIGARFVEHCGRAGIPVVAVDSKPHFSERPEHAGLDFGKIVDREALFEWLPSAPKPRAVVHMGACSRTTELDEAFLRRVNVEYSQKVWAYCASAGVPLVYASSGATYGDGAQGYADDETAMPGLRPLNPYGASKLTFDLWALEQERRGIAPPSWAGFKFFNVYGFGERHKGPMASLVLHGHDQIQERGSLRLFRSHKTGVADGQQSRDFIFVDDAIDVMRFALEKPIRRGIFNLGTGRSRPFVDLARSVFAAMKRPERIEFIDTPEALRPRYQYFTEAKMDRLRAEGYAQPFTTLETGVSRYVQRLLLQPGR